MSYGYERRPDMPERFVTGPQAEPRNQWPRKIRSLGGDAAPTEQILLLLNSSNGPINGQSGLVFNQTASYGSIVTTNNGWWAAVGRTGRLVDLTGTSPGNMGGYQAESFWHLSPYALVAGNWPHMPYVLKVGTVTACGSTTMAAGGTGGVAFGLCNDDTIPYTLPRNRFVGFTSVWNDPATYGAWSTWVASTSGSFTRATNTSFATNEPHFLEVEFDGVDRVIRWYVDSEQVDEYAPDYTDLFEHSSAGSYIEYWINASNGTTTRLLEQADTVPLVTISLRDLDE